MSNRSHRWALAVALAVCLPLASAWSAPANLSSVDRGDGRILLSVDLPEVNIVETWIDGRLQHEFQIDGAGWIGQPGAPDLPVVQRLVQLPDVGGLRLTMLGGESHEVDGLVPMPCQERMHSDGDLPLPWLQDEALYATDGFFPAQPWETGEPALARNRRVAQAAFMPVQVNPVTGVARVWTRMDFELSWDGSRVNERVLDLPVGGTAVDELLDGVVYEPGRDGALRDAAFDRGRMPGKYVVFGNSTALASSSLQALLDWKRRKGHEVVEVDQNDVSWTTTGIRNRIISEYNSANPVAYVLLIGDTDGSYPLPADNTAYDHFYAMIEGGDILGDVAVGRLSVDNATQLATVCNKILQYESDPYTLIDDAWLRSAGFTVGSSACYLSMRQLSRSIAGELVERRGYTNIDTAWCVGSTHVDDWFNAGISFYNYRGWIGMEGLSTSTVLALAQGPRTPVATIFTCSTGDFSSSDDFTEAFLRAGNPATPGGAVACMGFATASTHTRYNNVIVGGYYGGLLEHDLPEVGACLLQGKYDLYFTLPPSEQGNAANFAYWGNLMGDPGTPQWAGTLGALTASLPATLPLGADHLELTFTSGGQPVADVAVCAWQEASGTRAVALTDAAGHVLLPLDGLQGGALLVTATHHRYRPVLHTATVGQQANDASLDAWTVGGDARLTAGASGQALAFTLRNSGSSTMSGISVSAVLDAAHGTVSGGPLAWSSLSPGASHAFSGISLSGAAGLFDGESAPLRLQVSTGQGTYTLLADLHGAAPALSATSTAYPGGPLAPGATGTVRYTLRNDGSLTGSSLSATLVSEDADMATVIGGAQSLGTLAPGASANVDFDVAVGTLVNPGQILPLHVEWTAGGGAVAGETAAPATAGTPGVGDPTGPDAHGYFAYEDLDFGYLLAPSYNWYAISGPEGGPGTEVPLSDNGDEQDDGAWVDLPFVFTYYGQPYDRMLVCSNGFVSFAENGFGEFDFRNHAFPTAMGPDAMIAPMWDDHLTTGAAGAWTWYDTAQDAFVISWVGLPANSTGGPNSFQLVLYDPTVHETSTGDGPFLFQYLDFNDTQNHGADFPYCSVGFKDHTSTEGMTLLNFNTYAPTMHALGDSRAVYVSTTIGEFADTFPPVLSVAPTGQVGPGETVDLTVTANDFSGIAWVRLHLKVGGAAWQQIELSPNGNSWSHTVPGQSLGTVVQYWFEAEDQADPPNAGQTSLLSYTVVDGTPPSGPDGHGYLIYDSADALEGPAFDWIDISGLGQALNLGDDATTTVTLPFDFVYWGQSFSQLSVCSNGFVVAGSSSYSSYTNGGLAGGDGTPLMLCGFWDDLNPNSGGQVRVWDDASNHRFVVAWIDVPRYGTTDYQRFEMVIHDPAWWPTVSGDSPVLTQYALVGSATSCTIGHQDASQNDGVQYLFNGSYEANAASVVSGQALWLTTGMPALNPVDDLQAQVAGSQVLLSWTDTGAPAYRVYVDVDGYGAFTTLVGSTSGSSYLVPAIAGGRYYQVRAASAAVLSSEPRPMVVGRTVETEKHTQ